MCKDCYILVGSPAIINERTKAAASLITKVYDWGGLGGNAQEVVDNWNITNDVINKCLIQLELDTASPGPKLKLEEECLLVLRSLTEEERGSALAIHHNFL